MKKAKLVNLFSLSALTIFGLVGCGGGTAEYALVTDVGNIDDQSFNQTSWEALKDYATKNDKSYAYYRPSEDSTEARLASIDQAVKKGAKIVVCPGFLFEEAVYTAQTTYSDVKFVLIDGNPHTADYETYETKENTVGITFKEEISGYLAGYGAVCDGYTKLGYCGGQAVPSVQRFGSGYIQGINQAAIDKNVKVNVSYYYANAFAPTNDATSKMKSWYQGGMETVFSCGGSVYKSVIEGCKVGTAKNKSWIGVDTDQSKAPDVVNEKANAPILTSAVKGLREAVTSSLEAYSADKWDTIGGQNFNLGFNSPLGSVEARDYVGIPTEQASWGFKTFKKADYDALVDKIKAETLKISDKTDVAPTVDSTHCTVTWESNFAGNK